MGGCTVSDLVVYAQGLHARSPKEIMNGMKKQLAYQPSIIA